MRRRGSSSDGKKPPARSFRICPSRRPDEVSRNRSRGPLRDVVRVVLARTGRRRSAWPPRPRSTLGRKRPCQLKRHAGPGSMSMVTAVAPSWHPALITTWSNASARTDASGLAPAVCALIETPWDLTVVSSAVRLSRTSPVVPSSRRLEDAAERGAECGESHARNRELTDIAQRCRPPRAPVATLALCIPEPTVARSRRIICGAGAAATVLLLSVGVRGASRS